jgi:hypothetical protein
MSRLPRKYDRRIRRILDYRAVWLPGENVSLGDYGTLEGGLFTDLGALSEYRVSFTKEKRGAARLELNARGVSETLFQGGAKVPNVSALKANVDAKLKIKFGQKHTYSLRTTELSGSEIGNLAQVGRAIAKIDDWPHAKYWIVYKILNAKNFTFFGSNTRNREIVISGKGKAIARHLELGVTAGITSTSSRSLDLEIIGGTGPVAVGITRVKRNGRLRDV